MPTRRPARGCCSRTSTQSLAEIVRDINKFSNNVMARQLFLALGAIALGAPASYEKSTRAVTQWLAARSLAFPELVLENGSGLSRTRAHQRKRSRPVVARRATRRDHAGIHRVAAAGRG